MADKYAQLVELLETQGVLQFDGDWAEPIIAFVKKNKPKRNTRAKAGQGGEAVEVAAYITRPSRMTMDGWEEGEEYAVIASEASDADKRYDVPLMTVAQHQRILAAATNPADRVGNLDPDKLAQFIRQIDGDNRMGAGTLAEHICEWLAKP